MRRDGRQTTRTRADDGRRQRGAPEELECRDARGGVVGESEGERERERGRERERESGVKMGIENIILLTLLLF